MISFLELTLPNGLKVIIHRDPSTPLAAVNVLYNAGSRVEEPNRTGLAHLFEHLMFSGSPKVPDFDEAVQSAGGDANAFTNSDITNFYTFLPVDNLETVLWLESDRMRGLLLDDEDIAIQKKVVIEEFKETCLDQPYGNLWHHLSAMLYPGHPYRWPTIGLKPEHIDAVTKAELKAHFKKWYVPNNAVLSIAGNIDAERTLANVIRWFADIPCGSNISWSEPVIDKSDKRQMITDTFNVPVDTLYMGFLTSGRLDSAYYSTDLISDLLANGPSSRLYRRLVMDKPYFSHIDCYITGTYGPGALIIEAKPDPSIPLQDAEGLIWTELHNLRDTPVDHSEWTKIQNKNEAAIAHSQVAVTHKAMNLGYFGWLGDTSLINEESNHYKLVTPDHIQALSRQLFQETAVKVVYYQKNE